MTEWQFTTRSGSLYRVQCRADGTWWVTGDNVPNPYSNPWPDGHWVELYPPDQGGWLMQSAWPTPVGERMTLRAKSPDPTTVMRSGLMTTSVIEDVQTVVTDG